MSRNDVQVQVRFLSENGLDLDLTWIFYDVVDLDFPSFLRERTWIWLDLMQGHMDLDLRIAGLAHHCHAMYKQFHTGHGYS